MIKRLYNFLFNKKQKPIVLFYTKDFAEFAQYSIGTGTYGRPRIHDWEEGTTLTIGKYCSISSQVTILLGGNHISDFATTYPFDSIKNTGKGIRKDRKSKGDVIIGNDVWIG